MYLHNSTQELSFLINPEIQNNKNLILFNLVIYLFILNDIFVIFFIT